MGDIKSAYEIAMEKVAKIEAATAEERLKWKAVPKGELLAAKYLKDDVNLVNELAKIDDKEKPYVVDGIVHVLARNIDLPKNDTIKKSTRKAMDGIKLVKKDKNGVEAILGKIRFIFDHYAKQGDQQRQQAYEQLKMQFAAKVQQAMQQQGASGRIDMSNLERTPQFQEEWRKVMGQLDAQYHEHLSEYRKELLEIK